MSAPVAQLLGNGPVLPKARRRMPPGTRWTISILGLLLLIGVGVGILKLVQDTERFPVSNVDILGTVDYVDRDKLKDAVGQYIEKGFYGLDIDDVRESVEQLPWIARARVRRVWPGRLEVHVEEHEPGARWNDDQLLSKRLELFAPPQLQLNNPRYHQWREVFENLPQIRGIDGRHSELLDAYRSYEGSLAEFGLTLSELDEDERGSRTLVLSNNVTVRLGYEEQDLRMQRFVDVYERMKAKIERQADVSAATFDMRYSNGFALGGVVADLRSDVNGQSTRPAQGALQ